MWSKESRVYALLMALLVALIWFQSVRRIQLLNSVVLMLFLVLAVWTYDFIRRYFAKENDS